MTKRERQIYDLIKENPRITQNEISEKLNIARTSVAVHITHIVQKGYIIGRQYILRKAPKVLVIGACNVDIQGQPKNSIKLHDSNVGKIHIGFGGVARNIAVNLRKILTNVEFITVLDKSFYGSQILEDLSTRKINVENVIKVDEAMSIYLSVMDENGDMLVGVSDMDITRHITKEYLQSKKSEIEEAEIIVIDTNLPEETIEYIASIKKDDQKLVVDTVSAKKASKINGILDKIDYLKTNKVELEAMCDLKVKTKKEIKTVMQTMLKKGVKNIFLTLGADGIIASNEKKTIKLLNPKHLEIVSTTGAGDMFVSGLVYSVSNRFPLEKIAKIAHSASIAKLSYNDTTPEEFNFEVLSATLKKYYDEEVFEGGQNEN